MVRVKPEFLRHELVQFAFDFEYGLARSQTRAVGHAKYMRIDGHFRVAESSVQNHIGGFAPDAWQGLQCGAILGHRGAVQIDQHSASSDQMARLARVQADGLDEFTQAGFAQGINRLGRIGDREKFARREINALVGGLRGQNHRYQQFKRRAVFQFCRRMRIRGAQTAEYFVTALNIQGLHTIERFFQGDFLGAALRARGFFMRSRNACARQYDKRIAGFGYAFFKRRLHGWGEPWQAPTWHAARRAC